MVSQLHNIQFVMHYIMKLDKTNQVNCELNEVNFFVNWNVCKGLWEII